MPKTVRTPTCPLCGEAAGSRVTHTYRDKVFNREMGRMVDTIRRRRVCESCGCPFHTREEAIPEDAEPAKKPTAFDIEHKGLPSPHRNPFGQ